MVISDLEAREEEIWNRRELLRLAVDLEVLMPKVGATHRG